MGKYSDISRLNCPRRHRLKMAKGKRKRKRGWWGRNGRGSYKIRKTVAAKLCPNTPP